MNFPTNHLYDQELTCQLRASGRMPIVRNGHFATPPAVCQRMLALAELKPEHTVLEPSAGEGQLADYIRPHVAQVHVCELEMERLRVLAHKGYTQVGTDFLKFWGTYDRILMNPPFDGGLDCVHVRHAFTNCLRPGGVLVSIMSIRIAYIYNQTERDKCLRADILRPYGKGYVLPEKSFVESGSLINTIVVVLHKPLEGG